MYESYAKLINTSYDQKSLMLEDKMEQIDFLFHNSADRESNCKLNGKDLTEDPRIFNVQVKDK